MSPSSVASGFNSVSPTTATPNALRKVTPTNIVLQNDYNFTIVATAKGGFVFTTEPIMFIVGCT